MLAHKDLLIEAAYAGARKALEQASIPARFLTPKKTGQFLGIAEITLATWRGAAKGPPYTRLGRQIRYDRLDLVKYMSRTEADGEGPVKVFPGAEWHSAEEMTKAFGDQDPLDIFK